MAAAKLNARSKRAGAAKLSGKPAHADKTSARDLIGYAALIAVWVGGAALALYWKRSQLLIGFDGGYIFNLAQRQFEWHVPLFSASMDWFQGLGDVFFAINFRLLPSYMAASLFADVAAAKVTAYVVVLCELSFATVLFGLALGVSRAVSIAAAAVTCLVLFPFAKPTLVYGLLPMIPHFGSLMAAALLAAAAFIRFGRRGWLADLPFAAIALLLVTWSILISITFITVAAPFLFLCTVAATIGADGAAERRRKLCLLAALCLIAAAPALYLLSTILDSVAVMFSKELIANAPSFADASVLFHLKYLGAGPLLIVSGTAGAVLTARDETNRMLRTFAIALIVYLIGCVTFGVLIAVWDFWRGPAPLYFEYFAIPLYAVFAASFFARVSKKLWRARGWTIPSGRGLEWRIVVVATAVVLITALCFANPDYGFPYPPKPNQFTEVLARESGLAPGSAFRGRTANMTGRVLDRKVNWLDLHSLDAVLAQATGNELRVVGLHYFGVPTLFEYTPTISPAFYAVTTRLLALPGDRQMRNIVVTRRIEPRILAMLGVRFVITDRPFDGPARLRASAAVDDRMVLLYEIADPNIGNYSPTVVRAAGTASDVVARMADPAFDPQREIIADIAGPTDGLVPARNASVTFEGASLKLHAESDGRSLLLLPVEFSRCLAVEGADAGSGGPQFFRANLLETGVLFSGRLDATLSVRTGAFLNPACRLRDLLDARALGVKEVPMPERF